MRKIRLLIVDDSALARRVIYGALSRVPEFEVVGSAPNGSVALDILPQVKPDLMILDLKMPVMDGLQTLRAMRKDRIRLPAIMLSAFTQRFAEATLDALALGASDYALKPSLGDAEVSELAIREILEPKIKALCPWALDEKSLELSHQTPLVPAALIPPPRPASEAAPIRIVGIGVSTGGPRALGEVLPRLPGGFPVPIVIVQHMPATFTKALAQRLNQESEIEIVEAADGDVLRPGCAWIAPGGRHMTLVSRNGEIVVATNQDPPVNYCRPSVDVLLRSVASIYGPGTLAVILTGMGHDGLAGCANIRALGGQVLAQDEATSIVWGMPQAVVNAGLAEKTLPLGSMAGEILARVRSGPPQAP